MRLVYKLVYKQKLRKTSVCDFSNLKLMLLDSRSTLTLFIGTKLLVYFSFINQACVAKYAEFKKKADTN